jgi:CRISPR-associated endonuclease/helicase Cas3
LLVRHLIATHHGYGRPWFPACDDPKAPGAEEVWLGSTLAQAFAALIDKHGPWALAGMELVLRTSDIRQSIMEKENKDA